MEEQKEQDQSALVESPQRARVEFLGSFLYELINAVPLREVDQDFNFFEHALAGEHHQVQQATPATPLVNVIQKPAINQTIQRITPPVPHRTTHHQPIRPHTREIPGGKPPGQASTRINPATIESKPMQGQGSISMLRPLLNDPHVQAIECRGPGKQLLIHTGGRIKPTTTTLNNQQINQLVDEFSKNTRIPIVGGMLKAAFENVMVTAIVSQYSGSRFILQKKAKNLRHY